MFWRDAMASFLEWVQNIGPWGPVLFAAAYVPAAVLLVPGSLLTLVAGVAIQSLELCLRIGRGAVPNIYPRLVDRDVAWNHHVCVPWIGNQQRGGPRLG